MSDPRPKLMVERAMDKELPWGELPQAPHCDPRILHAVGSGCDFCDEATELQEERERLGVSNSGVVNRAWPCPADRARGAKSYHQWPNNRPTTKADLERRTEEFVDDLRKHGLLDGPDDRPKRG